MKILYIKDSFEPKYPMRDDVHIAFQSGNNGHDVTVLTSKLDLDLNPQSEKYFKVQDKSMEGIRILRSIGIKFPSISFCPYIPDKSIFGKYDLIYAHNIGSYSSFLAGALKLMKKVPMVLKADMSVNFYERLINNYFLRKVVLTPVHLADAITAFTAKEREFLIDLGIPAEKIRIIPIGIDFEKFSNLKKENGNLITIGYMGRFTHQKGIHRIIDAMKKIMNEYKEVKVLFAGQKTDIIYAGNIINELERCNGFKYSGFMKSSMNFYSQVDIVLIPSLWETGSIVTLEAMAAGKAVVASDINPHSEYIEHGVSGFLAKNGEEFYEYCKKLINDEKLRLLMCRNATQRAKEHDWNKIMKSIEIMYAFIKDESGGIR